MPRGARPGERRGGRTKGTPNRVTAEIRAVTQGLFDAAYWARTYQRLREGTLAPQIEAKLLAYAYGEPKQTIDMPSVSELAKALSRKVVDELHPGPTKSPA